jgi:hypothetical protein
VLNGNVPKRPFNLLCFFLINAACNLHPRVKRIESSLRFEEVDSAKILGKLSQHK